MAGGYLTTHVLDTARGCPAAGLAISLWRIEGESRIALGAAQTNADGRTDQPMLAGADFRPGIYELVFEAGAYLRASSQQGGDEGFLGQVPLRFGIQDAAAHYHVPLLLAPYAYSTYRGS